jgi:S-(hydroxymethyl)glutathione dehydrogenase / alcohol dehydrogenase
MRATAAVLDSPGRRLRLATIEVEPPGPGQVLVRIRACGVCRSDWHVQTTGEAVAVPVILGHEAAGVIETIGEGVRDLSPGDPVLLAWTPSCGRCPFCLRGSWNLCSRLRVSPCDATVREGARPLSRYMGIGGFAELARVAAGQAIPLPRDVALDRVCLIGCGVMTGYGAAVRAGRIRAGDAVAVFGCGGVGLSAVQGAAIAGADPMVAVDVSEAKLAVAARLGATRCVNAAERDPVAVIAEATGGLGADVAIEAVGATEVLAQAMAATRPGGTTVTVGLTALTTELRIAPLWLLLDRTLRGSIYGSACPPLDFPRLAGWYRSGRLRLDELVTGTFPLERVNDALDAFDRGDTIRSVIVVAA